MGAQGPLCSGIGNLRGGGCGAMQSDVEDHLGVRQRIQDATSAMEGALSLGFDFSLGGQAVPGSL
jgi:hypothetical protein